MKYADETSVNACSGCIWNVVLYGHRKEQTPIITLSKKATFLDPWMSKEKQNTTTQTREINNEFTNRPITSMGGIDSSKDE